jgi:hypothetical protein
MRSSSLAQDGGFTDIPISNSGAARGFDDSSNRPILLAMTAAPHVQAR